VLVQGWHAQCAMAARMTPVVAALTDEHIVAISAYLGSVN
jgi:hypothetical protein